MNSKYVAIRVVFKEGTAPSPFAHIDGYMTEEERDRLLKEVNDGSETGIYQTFGDEKGQYPHKLFLRLHPVLYIS